MMNQSAADIVTVNVSSVDQVLVKEAFGFRAVGAGNLALITRAGNSVVLPFLAGETRMVYATTILHTGTTATGVEAFIPLS